MQQPSKIVRVTIQKDLLRRVCHPLHFVQLCQCRGNIVLLFRRHLSGKVGKARKQKQQIFLKDFFALFRQFQPMHCKAVRCEINAVQPAESCGNLILFSAGFPAKCALKINGFLGERCTIRILPVKSTQSLHQPHCKGGAGTDSRTRREVCVIGDLYAVCGDVLQRRTNQRMLHLGRVIKPLDAGIG